jgi:hypothetical protein
VEAVHLEAVQRGEAVHPCLVGKTLVVGKQVEATCLLLLLLLLLGVVLGVVAAQQHLEELLGEDLGGLGGGGEQEGGRRTWAMVKTNLILLILMNRLH